VNRAEEAVAFIDARARSPFRWGVNDCAVYVADYGLSLGAADLLKGMRGYKSLRGALGSLKRAGYGTLLDLAQARLEALQLGFMAAGDVGFVPNGTAFGGGLGVFDGREMVGIAPEGIVRAHRSAVTHAFRFGAG